MEVFVVRTSHFFPNSPVENDEIEDYLGLINGKSSFCGRIVLRNNGIKRRYYALDRSGKATHTNAEMTANAVRGLAKDGYSLSDVDFMACGTASPEQFMPSHGAMVHGLLPEMGRAEVSSFQGSCCTSMQALKYAFLAISSGSSKQAVVAAGERMSSLMRAENFSAEMQSQQLERNPMLAFQKEFLRWMLSDGAAALLLTSKADDNGPSLRLEWVELTSFANTQPVCMCLGGEKGEDGTFRGWNQFSPDEWLTRSVFAFKQDTRILGSNIIKLGGEFVAEATKKHGLKAEEVAWYLPHMSSMYFRTEMEENMKRIGFHIPQERWFYNLPYIGNIASVSALAMVDELMATKKLERGQKILLMAPESARFTYGLALFTVV